MKKEKNDHLLFSPLNSEFAKKILKQYGVLEKADSMVFIEKGHAYLKSSAALRITKYLKGFWPLTAAFLIVPKFIRDGIYDYVAKNRITWFGSADYCDLMTPELKKRFLE